MAPITDVTTARWQGNPSADEQPVSVAGASLDPEARLQHARDLAWRSLNRRDRTVSELRSMLAAKRVEPVTIDAVVRELSDGGYLDDARYAQRFAEDRRHLDAWGAERIERRLVALGIAREHIEPAVREQDAAGELEAAVALLRRRFTSAAPELRERNRALGVLIRRGYDSETAYEALRRHFRLDGDSDGPA